MLVTAATTVTAILALIVQVHFVPVFPVVLVLVLVVVRVRALKILQLAVAVAVAVAAVVRELLAMVPL
jgi:hypothetical protein